MFPLILLPILGVTGLAAYLLTKKPAVMPGYQALTRTAANGVPVTVQVPAAPTFGRPPPPMVTTPTGTASLSVQSIEDAQRGLNALNFGPVPVDGNTQSPAMIGAVSRFEASQGAHMAPGTLDAANILAIQNALNALAQPAAIIGTHPTVTNATSSTPVAISSSKDVQHALNLLGATPPLTEDGSLGPKSTAAIKAFQTTHGLASDGIAGPKTKAALTLALRGLTSTMSGDPMPPAPPPRHHHHGHHRGHRPPSPPKSAA